MKKFEYQSLRFDFISHDNTPSQVPLNSAIQNFNDLGENGWELTGILPDCTKSGIAFFKRKKSSQC